MDKVADESIEKDFIWHGRGYLPAYGHHYDIHSWAGSCVNCIWADAFELCEDTPYQFVNRKNKI